MAEIELLKCEKCKTIQYPGRTRCKKCKSAKLVNFKCIPSGKIITHTTCSALPESIKHHDKVTFAIVELDCGGCLLSQIWPLDSVKIGSRVIGYKDVVSIQSDGTEFNDWVFKPAW